MSRALEKLQSGAKQTHGPARPATLHSSWQRDEPRQASARQPAPTFPPPPHLPGTFAPLRFQNCFLPPSLAMVAVTSSPAVRRGAARCGSAHDPDPLPQALLSPIPFHTNGTERSHFGTRKQPLFSFAPQCGPEVLANQK